MAAGLNATQGSLLGFLLDGPKTGWELRREVQASLARFWNVTTSHLYRELHALEQQQMVTAGPKGVRDQRPFTVTAKGRAAFGAWIARPPGPEQIRFPLLVTLWFGRHLDAGTRSEFVRTSRQEHEERLAFYRALQPSDEHAAAVVSFGVAYERAVIDWLDSLPAEPRPDGS